MLAKSIDDYFHFGTVVRFLQDVREGWRIHGISYTVGNIQRFFEILDELNLQVTFRASYELRDYLDDELMKTASDSKLTAAQAEKLTSLMSSIRKTLQAELGGFEAYIVTPKRLDVKRLLEDVSSLFAPDVYFSLPDNAIYDFEEAGKCIAFERPTAGAFHLLRGTEAVLRHYYLDRIKQKRVPLMWGNIVQDLKKRSKTKSNTALNNNLDNIRVSFRNPTQHPDKIYDIQEVQDLWGLCVDVINRMIHDMNENP